MSYPHYPTVYYTGLVSKAVSNIITSSAELTRPCEAQYHALLHPTAVATSVSGLISLSRHNLIEYSSVNILARGKCDADLAY